MAVGAHGAPNGLLSGFLQSLLFRMGTSMFGPFVQALVGLELQAAKFLVKAVVAFIVAPTPDAAITQGWFGGLGGRLAPVGKLVVFPLLFAATIGAVLRQDPRRLARIWLVGLPAAVISGAAVVQLTTVGLRATDSLTTVVKGEVYPHFSFDFSSLIFGPGGHVLALPETFLEGLLVVLLLIGAVVIWLEMVVRTAAIEVAVFFMPLALSGLVWPSTARWARRLLEVLVALLLMKPVIVGALCLGANAVVGATAGIGTIVNGAAIMLMAAFTPMALLKLVPVAEASAIGHLEGMARQPWRAASRALDRAKSYGAAAALGSATGFAGGGAAGGGVAGGEAGASSVAAHLLARVRSAGSSTGPPGRTTGSGGAGAGMSDSERLGPAAFPEGTGGGGNG